MKKGMKLFLSILMAVILLSGNILPFAKITEDVYAGESQTPAAVPDTLTIKETPGVCSGTATAYNTNSTSFANSKLAFYKDLLGGTHTDAPYASSNSSRPKASALTDWMEVAYILHYNKKSQSDTTNYNSRMEAMKYANIADYNLNNNSYEKDYLWIVHNSGLNYSNSLASANTDIRHKLYDFYLAQHTSSDNRKGWNWNTESATNDFADLKGNTKEQDVFWTILSLNRGSGDKKRHGHGSALIAVFYDFQISPVLQEDTGNTYVRKRSDNTDSEDAYTSNITNNTSRDISAEFTGSIENTVSHSSVIEGSSQYTLGESTSVGAIVNFGAFASGSVNQTFEYSETVSSGWSQDQAVSKTETKSEASSISVPAYSAVIMKRTTSESKEITSYNCPVLLTYKVMLLEHILNASNDEANAATCTLGTFGSSSVSAREDLKTYLTDNLDIKDTKRNVTWSSFKNNSTTSNAFHYILNNTAAQLPMSSAGASYTVDLQTISITYDGLISTQPLSRIEPENGIKNYKLTTGDTFNVSSVSLRAFNKAGGDYVGFQQGKGHWIMTDSSGKKVTSSSIATLSKDRTGETILKANKVGTVYLEYVIDEDCYATASQPANYMTNDKLANTTVLKITIEAPPLSATQNKVKNTLGLSEQGTRDITAYARANQIPTTLLLITDKTIRGQKSENIKGASYQSLCAKASKASSNAITLTWNKVKGADGYIVYGNKCGTKNKYKKIKELSSSKTTFTQKKLKKGTFYKYVVVAFKKVDGKKVTIAVSKTIHEVTSGGKYGNAKAVKVNKTKISLKKGKSYTLKASEVKKDKTLKKHRGLSYESTNTKIATVNTKGKITSKSKGSCYINVYAQNGICKKVKVTVK